MQKETLLAQAQALVSEFTNNGWTKSKLYRKIFGNKDSTGVLTHLYNNTELLTEETLLKIINELRPRVPFVRIGTGNFNTIKNALKDCQQRHQMVGLIGYPGAGKTEACQSYWKSERNVTYMECRNSMNRRQFFAKMLAEMGVVFTGSLYDMVQAIINELNSRQHTLLIIDEAGKMSSNVLLDLHDIRNATMHNAGIVLVGCEYFFDNLKKAVLRQKQGIPEFYSRVQQWYEMNPPTKKEIEAICTSNGVTDAATIKELQRLKNFRDVYNAIINDTATD